MDATGDPCSPLSSPLASAQAARRHYVPTSNTLFHYWRQVIALGTIRGTDKEVARV